METEKYVSFTTGSAGDPSKTIHGVNLGGWLVLERYITPYLFALTECDVSENPKYHVYPGQINLPAFLSDGKGENIGPECPPVAGDYPMDQWTMVEAFPNRELARKYLDRHWDTFVTEEDIVRIKNAGITHVRIPVGHWITGNIEENERYVTGEWPYLVRAIEWCRKHSIGVWIDLHTAPGSQNGFDNSGRANQNGPTGTGWSGSSSNVARTLEILDEISAQASEDGLSDVVGSFCILNEPFIDTDKDVYRTFVIDASEIVRRHLPDVTVVIGDTFDAGEFDAATWAIAKNAIRPALLDSHYYHVFFELARSFSPRQHIAYVCEHNRKDTQACCYDDVEGEEKVPSLINGGMGRVIGEWSASYDTLVFVKLDEVMDGIVSYSLHGEASYCYYCCFLHIFSTAFISILVVSDVTFPATKPSAKRWCRSRVRSGHSR
uniref:glucan 1,3-beta-glucosidase n=1 Tax=Corethron hystrix TaxID=216773 RepID=A0A7S1FZN2_9STRA|mmetsp:Transcript_39822/g.93338  ORF Transcript_39822/g.93338 Transcript_39822/m.93338 type:complete len:435 (+) Transcript_39822:163-1467(+)